MKLSVPKFIITVHKNTSKLQYVTREVCEVDLYAKIVESSQQQ